MAKAKIAVAVAEAKGSASNFPVSIFPMNMYNAHQIKPMIRKPPTADLAARVQNVAEAMVMIT